jgi:hypothetical protein
MLQWSFAVGNHYRHHSFNSLDRSSKVVCDLRSTALLANLPDYRKQILNVGGHTVRRMENRGHYFFPADLCPASILQNSHARAYAHHRLAVASEMPSTSAASPILKPTKYRSFTNSA